MPTNVRKFKTNRDIKQAFIQLLSEKSFQKITIDNICETALISRSTFYSHFVDKYTLLDQIVSEYTRLFTIDVDQRFKQVEEQGQDPSDISFVEIHRNLENHRHEITVLFDVHEPGMDLFSNRNFLIEHWSQFLNEHHYTDPLHIEFIAKVNTAITLEIIQWTLQHSVDQTALEQVKKTFKRYA